MNLAQAVNKNRCRAALDRADEEICTYLRGLWQIDGRGLDSLLLENLQLFGDEENRLFLQELEFAESFL